MPLVRIDLSDTIAPQTVQTISDVIYDAMREVANVPENDRYHIITRHRRDELVYPAAGYMGVTYTPDIIFIQVTWSRGRTVDVKKAFYRLVAENIHQKTGLRKEDIWINLVSVEREDWSFGNGIMQYADSL
ncbi:tautomerase family protein [Pararobbsia silviterrae]|uniref:Tautomerase family protein n=1 Tax=Pararobbsia silviterrae TaxID=1792498 RepID=A0A494XSA1_9BURK|nr:tautomerase family protein [Pararobbsia silviterrae]RKP53475.1 tautomerase family protein [Pararobbsia silviterrae]